MAGTECGFYRFSVQEMPSGDFIIRATPIGFFEYKGFGSIGFQLAEGVRLSVWAWNGLLRTTGWREPSGRQSYYRTRPSRFLEPHSEPIQSLSPIAASTCSPPPLITNSGAGGTEKVQRERQRQATRGISNPFGNQFAARVSSISRNRKLTPLRLINPRRFRSQRSRNHHRGSPFLCLAYFPTVSAGTLEITSGSRKRSKANGTVSNRDLLFTESVLSEVSSDLASRILDWTNGAHVSAQAGAKASRHHSVRRTVASPNRRGEMIDLPALLPPRNSSQYRLRKAVTIEGWHRW